MERSTSILKSRLAYWPLRAFGDFLEICSIGTNTEIVIILSKIRTCFGFGNEVEAYALASKVRYLLKGRKPGLFVVIPCVH